MGVCGTDWEGARVREWKGFLMLVSGYVYCAYVLVYISIQVHHSWTLKALRDRNSMIAGGYR